MQRFNNIAVFCGSSPGADPRYAAGARELGALLARRGIGLVYGGGNMGVMGELARAAMAAGGRAVGVIPERLNALVEHTALSELVVTPDMHARKRRMYELADAFIALPGGIGTMEELFEVFTWQQLGYHAKPVGLLDPAGFFRPVEALLDSLVATGFLQRGHRDQLLSAAAPEALLAALEGFRPSAPPKLPERRTAGGAPDA